MITCPKQDLRSLILRDFGGSFVGKSNWWYWKLRSGGMIIMRIEMVSPFVLSDGCHVVLWEVSCNILGFSDFACQVLVVLTKAYNFFFLKKKRGKKEIKVLACVAFPLA